MSSYPAHQPQYETRQEYLREPSSYSGGPDGSDEYADARQQSQHAYHDSHSQTALNAGQPMYSNADPSYDDLLAEKEMMQQQQQQQQRQSQFAMDEGANPRMSAYSRAGGPGGLAPSHLRSSMAGANGPRPTSQWTVGFEPPPKSTGILRMWRKENRAGWARVSIGSNELDEFDPLLTYFAVDSTGRRIPNRLPILLLLLLDLYFPPRLGHFDHLAGEPD